MRKLIISLIVILIVLLFSLGGLVYYLFYAERSPEKPASGETLRNPTEGLTDADAAARFNEAFVYYLLLNIKAYNLHNPPLSSDTPKIELFIGEDVYNAEVMDTNIIVNKERIDKKDIVIRTSKEEAVKMVRDSGYIRTSFSDGKSSLELVASKATLGLKGYLGLYEELK